MSCRTRRTRGFTLIELMVTVAVIVILSMIAFPSFEAQRQRAATRGAGDQLLSFWNQTRLEALKRNSRVKVGIVQSNSGKTFCLGAATTSTDGDATECDCTVVDTGDVATTCNVARFPNEADNASWNSVSVTGVTLGGGTDLASIEAVVIDPKRLFLAVPADAGTITLAGPPGRRAYQIRLSVDRFGRGYLCEPTSAVDKLSDFGRNNRRCSP